jgi:quinoprotein glucose dehydrogenase
VVAVDIRTGEYVWHFQTIHHDLWDHDPPAPPVLFDVEQHGTTVPALAVTTKSGYLYILNRETGDPIFGVEERPVPASDVPGEEAFPTQPIPSKPQGLARTTYGAADLVTAEETTAEHAAACRELVASVGDLYNAGPFSPWAHRPDEGSSAVTLLFPGLAGGFSWGGVAFDPGSGTLVAFSHDVGTFGWIEEAPEDFPVPYDRRGPRPSSFDVQMSDVAGSQRWPCQKPPWSQLTAVDAATGEIAWQRPLGVTEGLPPERRNTGRRGRAGAVVTASGLMFIAATDDNRFRALELATGDEVWATKMEQRGNANPMIYLGADDRQYVVVAATDQILAYRLP